MSLRFTFAFHARQVRFERDDGDGFGSVFPEVFSFHRERHDPAEFSLQLDDLLRKPGLISPRAHGRDSSRLMERLLSQAPRYIEGICTRLETQADLDPALRIRIHQDVALLCQLLLRFIETNELQSARPLRVADFLLRKQIYRSLRILVAERVRPEYLEKWAAGEVSAVDASDDSSESGFFHILEAGDPDAVDRMIVRMAERAFYLWLDGVCLDEENQAFEKEDSPFANREDEVLRAIIRPGADGLNRSGDLVVFLRRRSRDCLRLLEKLEAWFLRQYDIRHSSAVIHHAEALERGWVNERVTLSWHTTRIHVLAIALIVAPFMAAVLAYDRSPRFFDIVCAAEIILIDAVAIWFLLYRFCWKRDLSFFHASVPRIGAGIVVGYLPVLFIDEVWDLASRSATTLVTLGVLLGLVTLLYIYVEVQRRLGDTAVAFQRARGIFLLGVFQALGAGMVIISLVGRIMVSRNWSPDGSEISVEQLRDGLEPMIGQLPYIVGVDPFFVFPSAVVMMTFLSFFIGVFLQLLWEELPITEPL
ncbi:MAG: hypothetical protein VX466_09710 [Myxococcota bacterium]|nr:hypothetical protein [Myxococcota bacterium]